MSNVNLLEKIMKDENATSEARFGAAMEILDRVGYNVEETPDDICGGWKSCRNRQYLCDDPECRKCKQDALDALNETY